MDCSNRTVPLMHRGIAAGSAVVVVCAAAAAIRSKDFISKKDQIIKFRIFYEIPALRKSVHSSSPSFIHCEATSTFCSAILQETRSLAASCCSPLFIELPKLLAVQPNKRHLQFRHVLETNCGTRSLVVSQYMGVLA